MFWHRVDYDLENITYINKYLNEKLEIPEIKYDTYNYQEVNRLTTRSQVLQWHLLTVAHHEQLYHMTERIYHMTSFNLSWQMSNFSNPMSWQDSPCMAAWCISFFGIHPTFTHVPPKPEKQNNALISMSHLIQKDFNFYYITVESLIFVKHRFSWES